MEIRLMNNGAQIDGAHLVFRNFAGEAGPYNREGDRSFAIVLDDNKWSDMLADEGYNVKIKDPREEGDTPFMFLSVKVNFKGRPPRIYLQSGSARTTLSEDSISCFDNMDILYADLDIRAYDWNVNGVSGRTAYLDSICVHQRVDRFMEEMEDTE